MIPVTSPARTDGRAVASRRPRRSLVGRMRSRVAELAARARALKKAAVAAVDRWLHPMRAAATEGAQQVRAIVPGDRALYCLDCCSIYEAMGDQRCPACGSHVAWSIARAMERTKERN